MTDAARRRPLIAAATALGLVTIAWLGMYLYTRTDQVVAVAPAAASPSPAARAYACLETHDGRTDIAARGPNAECERLGAEHARRNIPRDDQQQAAVSALPLIRKAFHTGTSTTCHPRTGTRCETTTAPPFLIREAIQQAGFADTVVRPAQPGELAPEGETVAAVSVGTWCVLVTRSQSWFLGTLPDGTCLQP
ncbi:hypothetical protein [Actinoplanes couchii]|uniref:SH3 domain-containing protein n=1 Tax=Actinoplanes couchii TaxID=403638 RepID=A0ABQ3XLU6_9ACTN|nr:hypothetical protein [Actinoplanes couchii]MDR6319306.1 hypothetical protein [Actinoplanes couchii]GID59486.1 hypothetical protein Aco03nite_078900 [Actinoplanes couchii]